jgi:hypothetical protein
MDDVERELRSGGKGNSQQLPDWGADILQIAAGAMKYANGDVYVGVYKDGKKHFQGGQKKSFHTLLHSKFIAIYHILFVTLCDGTHVLESNL